MKVKAAAGLKVPKEGKPREYIGDDKTVTVPDSAYYKRLVRDGSLIDVDKQSAVKTPATVKGGKS